MVEQRLNEFSFNWLVSCNSHIIGAALSLLSHFSPSRWCPCEKATLVATVFLSRCRLPHVNVFSLFVFSYIMSLLLQYTSLLCRLFLFFSTYFLFILMLKCLMMEEYYCSLSYCKMDILESKALLGVEERQRKQEWMNVEKDQGMFRSTLLLCNVDRKCHSAVWPADVPEPYTGQGL